MIRMNICPHFLFSYKITFKVRTGHIPFQLVYGLYPLLFTKYLLPFEPSQIYDPNLVKVLTNCLSKLKMLQENQLVNEDFITSN
jgi:hypothetical protein